MDRFAFYQLEIWLKKNNKKPIIIRGARQVGKSTLIRLFAKKKGLILHEINLERNTQLQEVFASLNPAAILQELELVIKKGPITSKSCLVFLDEIQAIPEAIQSLRYFYEDIPEIAIVAAGSLMEFALAEKKFSMPVGRVDYLWLGPVSFNEFLLNAGDEEILKYKSNYNVNAKEFSLTCHNQCLKRLKEYNLTGGMPESVVTYFENKSLTTAAESLTSIINTYRDDIGKYAQREQFLLVQKVFDYLAKGNGKKIKYSHISMDHKARYVSNAVDLLNMAQVIFKTRHTSGNGVPLASESSEKHFKSYFLDVGLFHKLCGVRNLVMDKDYINKGVAAEQFIAQHLAYLNGSANRPELFYWIREAKTGNAETDFLHVHENNVIPVEVKAGKSGTLKSLQQFCFEKQSKLAIRYDLNRPSFHEIKMNITTKKGLREVSFTLLSLPLYMVEETNSILDKR